MAGKFVAVVAAAMLASFPGSGQNASDLLQKGLHLQEAAGDVDGAIVFFRQVVGTAGGSNKQLAAQAQYQLVLCMLQKGDRAAAEKELAALENNFAGMTDLIEKARKLIPGPAALLPEPWGQNECEQLNIKRDGADTGEYLFYSVDAWPTSVDENSRKSEYLAPFLSAAILRWELKTRNSTRSIELTLDRNTMRPIEHRSGASVVTTKPRLESNDDLGDALATAFVGPAADEEESVFLLRRLPLAVGFKTKLPVRSNTIAPVQMELVVTGMESVQTRAGKFNCYKVSFPGVGQTLWIGAEGTRPLVKFQSGSVEAELVKTWGAEDLLAPFAEAQRAAGEKWTEPRVEEGGIVNARFWNQDLTLRKIYTPKAEIPQELQRSMREYSQETGATIRPQSVQMRMIGGQQALSCLLDMDKDRLTRYAIWIRSEIASYEYHAHLSSGEVATFRWRFEPILAAVKNLQ